MKRTYYLAYGSNLNINRMLCRCPDAVRIGVSVIEDYKLAFRRGVLNIEAASGKRVPVGVWAISEPDEAELDRYEGYPRLYEKTFFRLTVNEKTIQAMAYIMTPGHLTAAPSQAYYDTVAEGYADFGFDPAPLLEAATEALADKAEFDDEVSAAVFAKKAVDAYARTQKRKKGTRSYGPQYCPRCGGWVLKSRLSANALSRYADIYICEACGLDEATRAFRGDPLPLKDWAIAQKRR